MLKRAVVIGASSGLGEAIVRRLVQDGYRVAAVARRKERLDSLALELNRDELARCYAYAHDVTDTDSAKQVFDAIVQQLDGLDLVVYCAGVMPIVTEDQYQTSIDLSIFDVNLKGAVSWLNLAAERFQAQQGGTIVGVGSVAGDRGRRNPGPAYASSKAALHTYLESLRNRLSQHGVTVITIKPGPMKTPMTEGLDDMPFVITAEEGADGVVSAINRRAGVAYVPLKWAVIMMVIRHIPSKIFRKLSI